MQNENFSLFRPKITNFKETCGGLRWCVARVTGETVKRDP